jgi:protein-disulfide isomerase
MRVKISVKIVFFNLILLLKMQERSMFKFISTIIIVFNFQSQLLAQDLSNETEKILHIEKYADFECPYGKRVQPMIKKLLAIYGSQAEFTFKTMPLDYHPTSRIAARYYNAVKEQGDDFALKFYNYTYENQNKLKSHGLNELFLDQVVKHIGADLELVKSKINDPLIEKKIDKDISEAVRLKINETPGLVINGHIVPGGISPTYDQIESVIKNVLSNRELAIYIND